ncbi:hypothetical protein ABPG74_013089 [Tetrahymena malaccensis]
MFNLLILSGDPLIIRKLLNFTKAIAKCTNLSDLQLDLGQNKLREKGAQALGQAISKCTALQNLQIDIYDNQIGNLGVKELFSPLENCNQLLNLNANLRENSIKILGLAKLLQSLSKCSNLLTVNCIELGNNIKYKDIQLNETEIYSGFNQCHNLQSLSLQLGYADHSAMFLLDYALISFQYLTCLNLNLKSNRISENGALSLVKSISKCLKLTYLMLDFSNYSFVQSNTINKLFQQRVLAHISKFRRLVKRFIYFQ